jgi:DNA-binding transcriptional LysR family regulator
MIDLNDFSFFAAVVQHGGFTAASRATGVDKARLSRHVAALEERLGVRLLQRSTRNIALTEAGQSFYAGCQGVMDNARTAWDSVLELKKEPSGTIRIACPVTMAQNYIAPILPGYMAAFPKVSVMLEATDRLLHPLEERFDVILCAQSDVPDSTSLVAREMGRVRRVLVAGRGFLDQWPLPARPEDLSQVPIIARLSDMHDETARWDMVDKSGTARRVHVVPRLVSGDMRVQLEAASFGIGVALLPETLVARGLADGTLLRVLPGWFMPEYRIYMVYPTPRGMLPSVRSFIDYLLAHITPRLTQTPD